MVVLVALVGALVVVLGVVVLGVVVLVVLVVVFVVTVLAEASFFFVTFCDFEASRVNVRE